MFSLSALRIYSYALGILGTALGIPLAVAILLKEYNTVPLFLIPMLFGWGAALLFAFRAPSKSRDISLRSAFSIVTGLWLTACLFSAIPLAFCRGFDSLVDVLFESISGFTTTGATVLANVEALPRSINLWRCQTHWLGGMGIIALAVALISLPGVGGFRLVKAETTGPDKGKVTSHIASTAKVLWFIYLGMTLLETLLLRWNGMDWVDALSHSFSTLGTGGFSTRNESIGAYHKPAIEWICTGFMFLASVNFALYFKLFTGRLRDVYRDTELRALIWIFASAILLITLLETTLGNTGFRSIAFTVAAILSSTGFGVSDYTTWLPSSQTLILALFLIGGCSGSTAGGVKIIRWTLLAQQLRNELRRLLHPHQVFSIRLNGIAGRESLVPAVSAFLFVYFSVVLLTLFAGTLAGLDLWTALTAALSMIGNIGPAFGALGPTANCGDLPAALKLWYCVVMLAGRLEIYTLLLCLGSLRTQRR